MATNITSTALDFQNIKDKLKTYLADKDEFTDYDFEGAGLSNILDVLAYNTHFNGLVANFSLNEAFLNTAQLRSSVVGHAEVLGLTVRSKTSSQVSLKVSLDLSSAATKPDSVDLPAYTSYTTTVDGTSYTFYTIQTYTATNDGSDTYVFVNDDGEESILAYEGELITKTFYVGETDDYQVYIIPDPDMDTATAVVDVYDSTSSSSYTRYTELSQAITVNANTTYYTIREAPNEYFDLQFGDGVTYGKAPAVGSKIVVKYLRASGDGANGSSSFSASSDITIDSIDYNQTVVTLSKSTAGADKQSIESIRQNAPIAFAAQQRLVTPLDYEGLIQSKFTSVRSVKAWGGQDNIPLDYGKMFISLQFDDDVSSASQTTVKANIRTQLTDKLSIGSITPEFVDPENAYLEPTVVFEYDPDLTGLTAGNMESRVKTKVINYINQNLNTFGKVFRRSVLLADIDEMDNAILSSKMDIKVQLRLSPTFGSTAYAYELKFPTPIALPDDVNHIIKSENFVHSTGVTAFIQNTLKTSTLELVNSTTGTVIANNVGSYKNTTGVVSINSLSPLSVPSGNTYIKFSATPANQSVVRPLRNYILKVDDNKTVASAMKDDQNTKVTL
tara:strand:+ start:391 stop:2235 length:1845 start_codon:yes stop_codon:yes gene_type:complete